MERLLEKISSIRDKLREGKSIVSKQIRKDSIALKRKNIMHKERKEV